MRSSSFMKSVEKKKVLTLARRPVYTVDPGPNIFPARVNSSHTSSFYQTSRLWQVSASAIRCVWNWLGALNTRPLSSFCIFYQMSYTLSKAMREEACFYYLGRNENTRGCNLARRICQACTLGTWNRWRLFWNKNITANEVTRRYTNANENNKYFFFIFIWPLIPSQQNWNFTRHGRLLWLQ